MNNKQKGLLGEQGTIFDLVKKGVRVLKPLSEDSPYDLVAEYKGSFIKIQCKLRLSGFVPKSRSHADKRGSHIKAYTEDEVDIFSIVTSLDGENVLYIPYEYAGILLKKEVDNYWGYLEEDFKYFPCKDKYEKKIRLSNGKIISETEKERLISSYNKDLSMKENSEILKIPYHTLNKWVYPSKDYR